MDFLKEAQCLFPLLSCFISGGLSVTLGFLTTRNAFSTKSGVVVLGTSALSGVGSFVSKAVVFSSSGEN